MVDADQSKLFIGGISWETTEDVLNEHFGKYGAVISSVIAKDRNSGVPRGFAFVTFTDSSAVDRALQDSHLILNRTVEVKRAIPRSEQQNQQLHHRGSTSSRTYSKANYRSSDHIRTKKIFVGGLSANLREEDFRRYFEKFGRINDVVVMHDNMTHRPRGFGFITFDAEESVEQVMQTNFHELSGKLVEVKRAVPKDGTTSSSSNGYGGRVGGGRSPNVNSYPQAGYPAYQPRFGFFPNGYASLAGYPYGNGIYSGSYPPGNYPGFSYMFAPFGPRNDWNAGGIGVRGNFFPYMTGGPVYPPYVNGSSGVMSFGVNDYNGTFVNGLGMKPAQVVELEVEHSQIDGNVTAPVYLGTSEDTGYYDAGKTSTAAGFSKPSQENDDKTCEATNSS